MKQPQPTREETIKKLDSMLLEVFFLIENGLKASNLIIQSLENFNRTDESQEIFKYRTYDELIRVSDVKNSLN